MLKIGLSSKSNPFTDELFSSYVDAGIHIMEVSRCTEGYDGVDFQNPRGMAGEEYGESKNPLGERGEVNKKIEHIKKNYMQCNLVDKRQNGNTW